MIEIKGLQMAYGDNIVLQDMSFSIPKGSVNTIIGANGCGKTTLFKAISKRLRPKAGSVTLDGKDVWSYSNNALAREMAVLPQNPRIPSGYTVFDLVSMGRSPYLKFMGRQSKKDEAIVEEAISDVGLMELAHRNVLELSGGERQRAWIAMCLAQQPQILLLDEPTTFLDISFQYEIMRLVRKLNLEKGITVLMILHDLNQGIRYSDQVIAISNKTLYEIGDPAKVINEKLLEDVFHLQGEVIEDPVNGCPLVIVKK